MKKILVVSKREVGACQAYRILYPYNALRNHFEIDFAHEIDDFYQRKIKEYQIVVFHKDHVNIKWIQYLKSEGIKVIVDFDDYWMLSNRHILFDTYHKNFRTEELIGIIKAANYITTTTKRLASKIADYNMNVVVHPNAIPEYLPQFIINADTVKQNIFRFGYLGGMTHLDDVKLLSNVLPELYRNAVESKRDGKAILDHVFYLFGFDKNNSVLLQYCDIITDTQRYINNFRGVAPLNIYNFPQFYNDIDVSLAPLEYDYFNSMKSELKIVEAGIMKTCIIASNVFPYKNHIVHGENGLLAKNAKDFGRLAKFCVNNPDKVKQMAENLYHYVKESFDFQDVLDKRIEFLNTI